MTAMDRLRAMGQAAQAAYVSPPPSTVASTSWPVREPADPPIYTNFNFREVNDEFVVDGVRIYRGGFPFHISRHPRAAAEPAWDYSIWAGGTDAESFVLEFLDPVFAWAIHGTCFIPGPNGEPIPSHPYAWTWREGDAPDDPFIRDTSFLPLTAPSTHNKRAIVPAIGEYKGWIVRAECNVWVGGTGSGPTQFDGSEKRNGFIGGYLTWQR